MNGRIRSLAAVTIMVMALGSVSPVAASAKTNGPSKGCRSAIAAADKWSDLVSDFTSVQILAMTGAKNNDSATIALASRQMDPIISRITALRTEYAAARKACLGGK